jgi:hypothetical protein
VFLAAGNAWIPTEVPPRSLSWTAPSLIFILVEELFGISAGEKKMRGFPNKLALEI